MLSDKFAEKLLMLPYGEKTRVARRAGTTLDELGRFARHVRDVRRRAPRVVRIGRALGLRPEEMFVSRGSGEPASSH